MVHSGNYQLSCPPSTFPRRGEQFPFTLKDNIAGRVHWVQGNWLGYRDRWVEGSYVVTGSHRTKSWGDFVE
jgi:hypothetical protein